MLELRQYQKELLAYHLKNDRSIDTSAPGCGKTPILAMWMKMRYQINGCKSIFTMPSSILLKNQEEVMNWTSWSEDEVVICNGTPKKREELYKKPTRSPKKPATKPKIGPNTIPASTEAKIVKENCVSANLNSNIFAITTKAVMTAMYAILWLVFFLTSVLEKSNSFHFLFSCIIKTSFYEVRNSTRTW